jgi:hypothetical protein
MGLRIIIKNLHKMSDYFSVTVFLKQRHRGHPTPDARGSEANPSLKVDVKLSYILLKQWTIGWAHELLYTT